MMFGYKKMWEGHRLFRLRLFRFLCICLKSFFPLCVNSVLSETVLHTDFYYSHSKVCGLLVTDDGGQSLELNHTNGKVPESLSRAILPARPQVCFFKTSPCLFRINISDQLTTSPGCPCVPLLQETLLL